MSCLLFFRIVDYYQDMYCKRAHTLSPLTKLCSTKVKFKLNDVENNSFVKNEQIGGIYVLLFFNNFSEEVIIYTHDLKIQHGG